MLSQTHCNKTCFLSFLKNLILIEYVALYILYIEGITCVLTAVVLTQISRYQFKAFLLLIYNEKKISHCVRQKHAGYHPVFSPNPC